MTFYEGLYTGALARKRADQICRDLKAGKYPPGVCLVTLARGKANLLDMVYADQLKIPEVREGFPMVVGIAVGKDEAVLLAQKIVQDCLDAGEGTDVRRFLQHGGRG